MVQLGLMGFDQGTIYHKTKVNNRNTRTSEICSKLTIKTPERRHWRRSGVFIVNFEYISNLVLIFLLLTLNTHRKEVGGLQSCHVFADSIAFK